MGITIGADPEFILEQNGRFLSADNILKFDSHFGLDGANSTGELRPHYGNSALKLTANIQRLIRDGVEEIPELKGVALLSGHYKHGNPIGGHVHLAGFSFEHADLGSRLDAVYNTLSNCIDDLEERDRRCNTSYGKGWRCDRGPERIEYRAPGSWLLSPQVAFMNLWLMEATAYAYVNGQSDCFEALEELGACAGLLSFAQKVEGVGDKKLFMKVADKIFSHLPLDWNQDFKENW